MGKTNINENDDGIYAQKALLVSNNDPKKAEMTPKFFGSLARDAISNEFLEKEHTVDAWYAINVDAILREWLDKDLDESYLGGILILADEPNRHRDRAVEALKRMLKNGKLSASTLTDYMIDLVEAIDIDLEVADLVGSAYSALGKETAKQAAYWLTAQDAKIFRDENIIGTLKALGEGAEEWLVERGKEDGVILDLALRYFERFGGNKNSAKILVTALGIETEVTSLRARKALSKTPVDAILPYESEICKVLKKNGGCGHNAAEILVSLNNKEAFNALFQAYVDQNKNEETWFENNERSDILRITISQVSKNMSKRLHALAFGDEAEEKTRTAAIQLMGDLVSLHYITQINCQYVSRPSFSPKIMVLGGYPKISLTKNQVKELQEDIFAGLMSQFPMVQKAALSAVCQISKIRLEDEAKRPWVGERCLKILAGVREMLQNKVGERLLRMLGENHELDKYVLDALSGVGYGLEEERFKKYVRQGLDASFGTSSRILETISKHKLDYFAPEVVDLVCRKSKSRKSDDLLIVSSAKEALRNLGSTACVELHNAVQYKRLEQAEAGEIISQMKKRRSLSSDNGVVGNANGPDDTVGSIRSTLDVANTMIGRINDRQSAKSVMRV